MMSRAPDMAHSLLRRRLLSGFLALTTPFWGLLLALAVVFLAFLELSHPRPRRRARAALAVAGTSAVVAGAALLVGFAELATIVPGAPDGTVLEVRIEERLDRVDLHEASLAGDERRAYRGMVDAARRLAAGSGVAASRAGGERS